MQACIDAASSWYPARAATPGSGSLWSRSSPKAGFHSVAVSLPNWPGATFADHADAIVAAAGAPDEVTLVAQSMGAFSAPLTCDRLPVSELVLLNAMIPAPGETAGEWWGNTGQADSHAEQRPT